MPTVSEPIDPCRKSHGTALSLGLGCQDRQASSSEPAQRPQSGPTRAARGKVASPMVLWLEAALQMIEVVGSWVHVIWIASIIGLALMLVFGTEAIRRQAGEVYVVSKQLARVR